MRPLDPSETVGAEVDGVPLRLPAGTTVLDACSTAGIDVPSFCHHPSLTPTGTCDACVVTVNGHEVRACVETANDGSQINSKTKAALARRRAALSVLLSHHPLQCSVCPQSGACELQSHVANHMPVLSAPPEPQVAQLAFSDDWLARPGLCVGCTRCTRFANEVLKRSVLVQDSQGNQHNQHSPAPVRIARFPQADPAPYAGSFADLCPVGVFAKPCVGQPPQWRLRSQASICSGCATGCPIWLDVFGQRIYQVRARGARGFLCDDGYALALQPPARVVVPSVDGLPTSWDVALAHAAKVLQDAVQTETLAVVVSAELPSEDLLALSRLARDRWRLPDIYLAQRAPGQGDAILRHSDKNPNTAGAELLLGAHARTVASLLGAIESGKIASVLVLGPHCEPALAQVLQASPRSTSLVIAGAYDGKAVSAAQVVLPLATWAEVSGSFVNHEGLGQVFFPAHAPAGDALPGWEIINHLAATMGVELGFESLASVRRELRACGMVLPSHLEPARGVG